MRPTAPQHALLLYRFQHLRSSGVIGKLTNDVYKHILRGCYVASEEPSYVLVSTTNNEVPSQLAAIENFHQGLLNSSVAGWLMLNKREAGQEKVSLRGLSVHLHSRGLVPAASVNEMHYLAHEFGSAQAEDWIKERIAAAPLFGRRSPISYRGLSLGSPAVPPAGSSAVQQPQQSQQPQQQPQQPQQSQLPQQQPQQPQQSQHGEAPQGQSGGRVDGQTADAGAGSADAKTAEAGAGSFLRVLVHHDSPFPKLVVSGGKKREIREYLSERVLRPVKVLTPEDVQQMEDEQRKQLAGPLPPKVIGTVRPLDFHRRPPPPSPLPPPPPPPPPGAEAPRKPPTITQYIPGYGLDVNAPRIVRPPTDPILRAQMGLPPLRLPAAADALVPRKPPTSTQHISGHSPDANAPRIVRPPTDPVLRAQVGLPPLRLPAATGALVPRPGTGSATSTASTASAASTTSTTSTTSTASTTSTPSVGSASTESTATNSGATAEATTAAAGAPAAPVEAPATAAEAPTAATAEARVAIETPVAVVEPPVATEAPVAAENESGKEGESVQGETPTPLARPFERRLPPTMPAAAGPPRLQVHPRPAPVRTSRHLQWLDRQRQRRDELCALTVQMAARIANMPPRTDATRIDAATGLPSGPRITRYMLASPAPPPPQFLPAPVPGVPPPIRYHPVNDPRRRLVRRHYTGDP